MKKIIILSALVFAVSASAFAAKPTTSVKVVSKTMDVVYFKVSCDLIGATIEVKDIDGNVIFSSQLTDKKVIVDFYAEPSGEYTIHVKKNGNDESITYFKNTVSHAALADHNHVSITQM